MLCFAQRTDLTERHRGLVERKMQELSAKAEQRDAGVASPPEAAETDALPAASARSSSRNGSSAAPLPAGRGLLAGDKARITRAGDPRFEQVGTVVHVADQGAKVRFVDGREEGFKHSSLRRMRPAEHSVDRLAPPSGVTRSPAPATPDDERERTWSLPPLCVPRMLGIRPSQYTEDALAEVTTTGPQDTQAQTTERPRSSKSFGSASQCSTSLGTTPGSTEATRRGRLPFAPAALVDGLCALPRKASLLPRLVPRSDDAVWTSAPPPSENASDGFSTAEIASNGFSTTENASNGQDLEGGPPTLERTPSIWEYVGSRFSSPPVKAPGEVLRAQKVMPLWPQQLLLLLPLAAVVGFILLNMACDELAGGWCRLPGLEIAPASDSTLNSELRQHVPYARTFNFWFVFCFGCCMPLCMLFVWALLVVRVDLISRRTDLADLAAVTRAAEVRPRPALPP